MILKKRPVPQVGCGQANKFFYDNFSMSTQANSLSGGRIIMSVQTVEKRSTSQKHAPRYRVLLHNDDVNSMEYVVQTLMKTVPNITQPQAVNIMMEAHTNGMALVIVCELEHAEFYSETLRTHGLTSTIEPEE
jgi:ATP-dependent Clp protease adaptor protein ClpS